MRAPPPKLPPPPATFTRRKEQILAVLDVPDQEYTDASPKGSVDVGIRGLIADVNGLDGFVTTSSCAGRVSVFVEGRKRAALAGDVEEEGEREEFADAAGEGGGRRETVAAVGGKGGGGAWLFVSHDPVPLDEKVSDAGGVKSILGIGGSADEEKERRRIESSSKEDTRLVHFKFEPMILHVLTASPSHAQALLRSGLQAGFRESGAINLTAPPSSTPGEAVVTPIVAIRSMGLSFESLIGVQVDGATECTVSDGYLLRLLEIANERFQENTKRIERFRSGVLKTGADQRQDVRGESGGWEDPQVRRERKRAEGLRRREEMQSQKVDSAGGDEHGDANIDLDIPTNLEVT